MTSYHYDFYGPTAAPANVVLKANLYEIEIKSFTYSGRFNNTEYGGTVSRYSPAILTGGTAYTPGAYRDGSGTASATLRSGTTVSGGTNFPIHAYPYTTQLSTDFAVTIKPGDAIIFAPNPAFPAGTGPLQFAISFDEYHLARSR